MFSGIVETLGEVRELKKDQRNLHITLRSEFSKDLKVDQSVAHNGVCLTVIQIQEDLYTVTAIDETLQKTNLGYLKVDDKVNLERCLRLGDRLDGHIVQGHVDQTGTCIDIKQSDGSWIFTFEYDDSKGNVTVEKGSICVNGVSLTVVNSKANTFSVCIIPYTCDHTNFNSIQVGTIVNLEFDILGKYISKLMPK